MSIVEGTQAITSGYPDLIVTSPFDGGVIGAVPQNGPAQLEQILQRARTGFQLSRSLSRFSRHEILQRASALLRERAETAADLIVREAGKTVRQARKEVSRAVMTLSLSADAARSDAGEVVPFDAFQGSENRRGWFTREPLGIIVAITPYNDALNLVAHKLGPAIAGGSGAQLKTLLGTLASALPGGKLPSSCALTAGTVPTTITLDQGAVVIEPDTATLTVDLGKLLSVLGLNLNSLPANTDLLAYLLNNLGDILSTGLERVISGITTPLRALGDACLPALGPLAGVVTTVLDSLTSGQAQLESAINSISSSLSSSGAPGLKTLTDQLSKLLAIGVNVQQGAFPLAGTAKPKYVYSSKLAATPNQSTPVVNGQGVVRAIEIDLLGGQAASLALASAAAGPSAAVVAPTTAAPAPTISAPNTQLPTGVPAGAAGHGDTTPTLPLVLLMLGLVLAGGGATFYRTRGKFGR